MNDWFSFDGGDGIEWHATEAEARARAERCFDLDRDNAREGWPEWVEDTCYGRVVGRVVETLRRPVTDDDGLSGCDEYVDYALVSAPDARHESALAGESAALEAAAGLRDERDVMGEVLNDHIDTVRTLEGELAYARAGIAEERGRLAAKVREQHNHERAALAGGGEFAEGRVSALRWALSILDAGGER